EPRPPTGAGDKFVVPCRTWSRLLRMSQICDGLTRRNNANGNLRQPVAMCRSDSAYQPSLTREQLVPSIASGASRAEQPQPSIHWQAPLLTSQNECPRCGMGSSFTIDDTRSLSLAYRDSGGTGMPEIFTVTEPRWFRLVKYSVLQRSPPKPRL